MQAATNTAAIKLFGTLPQSNSGTHTLPQTPRDGSSHGAGCDPVTFHSRNCWAAAEHVESRAFDAAQRLAVKIVGHARREPSPAVEQCQPGHGFLIPIVQALGLMAHQVVKLGSAAMRAQ